MSFPIITKANVKEVVNNPDVKVSAEVVAAMNTALCEYVKTVALAMNLEKVKTITLLTVTESLSNEGDLVQYAKSKVSEYEKAREDERSEGVTNRQILPTIFPVKVGKVMACFKSAFGEKKYRFKASDHIDIFLAGVVDFRFREMVQHAINKLGEMKTLKAVHIEDA